MKMGDFSLQSFYLFIYLLLCSTYLLSVIPLLAIYLSIYLSALVELLRVRVRV